MRGVIVISLSLVLIVGMLIPISAAQTYTDATGDAMGSSTGDFPAVDIVEAGYDGSTAFITFAGTPDLDRALENVPVDSATILMSHSPNILPEVVDRPLIVLAGHTHGGQIRLPWQESLVGNDPSFFSQLVTAYEMTGYLIYGGNKEGVGAWRYMEGWFYEGRAAMYVCRGLGVTRPPVRYDCPAEMTLFTLRSGRIG